MSADTTIPRYREDIYSTAAILDPYPHYAELRALGPVVWLSRTKVYAVTRYAECKDVLLDDETFISGDGVALNPVANLTAGRLVCGTGRAGRAHGLPEGRQVQSGVTRSCRCRGPVGAVRGDDRAGLRG